MERDPNAATFRIFTVDAGSGPSLTDLSITGGIADGTGVTDGGGIRNEGMLSLNNDDIYSNSAATNLGAGGGIFNDSSATLNVNGCTISSNSADGRGGGIYNDGTLNISGQTYFTQNTALIGGGIDKVPAGTPPP